MGEGRDRRRNGRRLRRGWQAVGEPPGARLCLGEPIRERPLPGRELVDELAQGGKLGRQPQAQRGDTAAGRDAERRLGVGARTRKPSLALGASRRELPRVRGFLVRAFFLLVFL